MGKDKSSPDWTDPVARPWRADLNGDERVDTTDSGLVVTRFGQSGAPCAPPSDPSQAP